jgi:Flp pilus assembly protein TadD
VERHRVLFLAAIAIVLSVATPNSRAGDLKITIPKRSRLTPVQQYNRDGVAAVRKQEYDKAETLFYKAYLLDSGDPFTLFNLGYISELQGDLDRAQKFYTLASEQATDAMIDRANSPALEGRPMTDVANNLGDLTMRVNRDNIEATRLLSQGRATEADLLLQKTLTLDAGNAFTLNNLGVAKEAEGDIDAALHYYTQAATTHSSATVIVSSGASWKGKPISEMSATNARDIEQRLAGKSTSTQAALLNLCGVAALNRNEPQIASQDFLKAYSLDPNSAFSLNNEGYLAEMSGDLETAQFFYEKARNAPDAYEPVGFATRRSAEGAQLSTVAGNSDQQIEARIDQEIAAKHRQHNPIQLRRRDGQPITRSPDPAAPPQSTVPLVPLGTGSSPTPVPRPSGPN